MVNRLASANATLLDYARHKYTRWGYRAGMWKSIRSLASLAMFVIGLAGIPDDLKAWGRWMEILEAWIDHWRARVLVAVPALLLATYP